MISMPFAFAEEYLVTTLTDFEIVFDGKWTDTTEWKKSTEKIVMQDGKQLFVIRIAHDYDDLFVFLDVVSDDVNNAKADKAIICIDSINDKDKKPQGDDYCFQTSLGGNTFTFVGGADTATTGFFRQVENHDLLIAISSMSDESDRYSKKSHVSYEFKIPLDVIGRSDNYGFYVGILDGQNNEIMSWPQNIERGTYPFIPRPELWGELISPDRSLPEFGFPILFAVVGLIVVAAVSRIKITQNIRKF